MEYDICKNCKHCDTVIEDPIGNFFYHCNLDDDFISEEWALDQTIGCDGFEQKLDDNETKKP